MDVPGERLPQQGDGTLASYLLETVAPQVPQQLRAAFEAAVHAGRMRSMQNKQMPAAPLHCPGALLLGDAFNMRHPLTGGGMTVRAARLPMRVISPAAATPFHRVRWPDCKLQLPSQTSWTAHLQASNSCSQRLWV